MLETSGSVLTPIHTLQEVLAVAIYKSTNSIPDNKDQSCESWLPIQGWHGYEASDFGRIRSWWTTTGGMRKEPRILCGDYPYRRVTLRRRTNGILEKIQFLVHRIIIETFIGPCPKGMICRHLDDNPKNNRLENLEWGTYSQNTEDAIINGRKNRHVPKKTTRTLRKKPLKLTMDQAMEIKTRRANGETLNALSTEFGVCKSLVCNIAKGYCWKTLNI